MKKLIQFLCVFLSVIIFTSIFGVSASAASKPKLSNTSLTMIVGSSKTLTVTGASNTVIWSSSDTSVCTVNKQGKIKAQGIGTAKICANVGSKKLYCKVNVVKSYISSISDKTMNKGDQITLSFKSYNVKSAKVYSSDESIVKIVKKSANGSKINATVEAVSGGTAYINIVDNNNSSAAAKVKITVNAPVEPTANTSDETTSIKIKLVDNGDGTTSIVIVPVYDDVSQDGNPGSSADYAQEILDLVNEERAKTGAAAISLDDELCKAAQVRAKELGENFSHTRPDGTECFTVLKEYNISCVYAGENIAYGTSTSKGAMEMWMNSPGHRSNILRSGWRKLGVGYDETTNSWVQIFTD